MLPGVSKSGSPISRGTMSRPFASSARAFTSTSKAVSVPRRAMRLARRSSRTLVIACESSSSRRFSQLSTINSQLFFSQIDVRASPRFIQTNLTSRFVNFLPLLTFRQRYGNDRRPFKIGGIFDRTIRLILPYVRIAHDMKGVVGNRAGRRFVEVRVMMRLQHRKIDRKSVVEGKRVELGGRRINKKKKNNKRNRAVT